MTTLSYLVLNEHMLRVFNIVRLAKRTELRSPDDENDWKVLFSTSQLHVVTKSALKDDFKVLKDSVV